MAWIPPRQTDAAVLVPAASAGVPIRLESVGLSATYRKAFSAEEPLAALSAGLAACVRGTPRVVVSYDPEVRLGRVSLVVAASDLGCRGTEQEGGALDLAPLAGVGRPLATWRNSIAAATDLRVYAFKVGVHVTDSWGHATLWLDGQDPLDGTAFGRCLGLDGFDRCPHTREAARDGVLAYPLDDLRLKNRLRDLLGPVAP